MGLMSKQLDLLCAESQREGRVETGLSVPVHEAQPVCGKGKCYLLCTSGGGQKEKANKIMGMMGLGTL